MAHSPIDPDELLDPALDDDQRDLLARGLAEWGGPASCTEEMAIALGFASVLDLFAEGDRIGTAIRSRAPVAKRDWARAQLATEVVFASSRMGSGLDWTITTGRSDEDTIAALRAIGQTLSGCRLPVIGTPPTDTPLALRLAEEARSQPDVDL